MIVGLPGAALAGLFYLLCAVASPVVALRRWLGARSRHSARWRVARRQLAVGLLSIVGYLVVVAVADGAVRWAELTAAGPGVIAPFLVDVAVKLALYGGFGLLTSAVLVLCTMGMLILLGGSRDQVPRAPPFEPPSIKAERPDLSSVWSTTPTLDAWGWQSEPR